LISISSLISAFWIILGKLYWGYSVEGWSSLMVSIFFLSGIILVVLGIQGIYLGRVFQEVNLMAQKRLSSPQLFNPINKLTINNL
jgi:hypothetical protein